jgi:hypothetical protein
MKNLSLVFIAFYFFVFTSCQKEELADPNDPASQQTTYELGQEHAGGIIIELDATQQHGLVVAKVDQVTYANHINWSDSKAQVEAYDAGGTGWRLPTKTELELIYQNQSTFNLTGFDSRNYWSSNVGNGSAWSQYFGIPGGITSSPWKQLSNCTLCSRGVKEF